MDFKSGGYVQLDIPACTVAFSDMDIEDPFRADWQKMGLFDLKMKNSSATVRAYSMASYPAENRLVKLNVRIATPPFNRKKGRMEKVNPGIASAVLVRPAKSPSSLGQPSFCSRRWPIGVSCFPCSWAVMLRRSYAMSPVFVLCRATSSCSWAASFSVRSSWPRMMKVTRFSFFSMLLFRWA